MRRSRHQDDDTIAGRLKRAGVSRRDFMGFCGKLMVAAPFGLAITNFLSPEAVAGVVGSEGCTQVVDSALSTLRSSCIVAIVL